MAVSMLVTQGPLGKLVSPRESEAPSSCAILGSVPGATGTGMASWAHLEPLRSGKSVSPKRSLPCWPASSFFSAATAAAHLLCRERASLPFMEQERSSTISRLLGTASARISKAPQLPAGVQVRVCRSQRSGVTQSASLWQPLPTVPVPPPPPSDQPPDEVGLEVLRSPGSHDARAKRAAISAHGTHRSARAMRLVVQDGRQKTAPPTARDHTV